MADEPNAGYMGKKLRKIEKRRRSREREKDRKTGRLNNQRALIGCRPREVAQWKRGGRMDAGRTNKKNGGGVRLKKCTAAE